MLCARVVSGSTATRERFIRQLRVGVTGAGGRRYGRPRPERLVTVGSRPERGWS